MSRILSDAVRGPLAGAVATWVMDQVTTGMLNGRDPAVTAREKAGRPLDRA